jgi:hypothetical protein
MFLARSSGVERAVGRMIQRITRDMIRGLIVSFWECKACRKSGRVVKGVRERRWIAQTGILMLERNLERMGESQETEIIERVPKGNYLPTVEVFEIK